MDIHQVRQRDIQRKQALTAKGQDIFENVLLRDQIIEGPTAEGIERRLGATTSFFKFIETYGSQHTPIPFSDSHLRVIDLLESSVLESRRFCLAMPRGSGKSTICILCSLWSILCGHSPYTLFINDTASSSIARLNDIQVELFTNDLLLEDFPELVIPFKFLNNQANRAKGQKWNKISTNISWQTDRIKTATLNDGQPFQWMLDNGIEPAYGFLLETTAITSSFRGKVYTKPDGSKQRPTFVIADDIQTRESAMNMNTVDKREQIVKADIAGLAGPSDPMGMAIPCTVIYPNDLADRLLDHARNPEFRGERVQMLPALPGHGEDQVVQDAINRLWDDYDQIRRSDALHGTEERTKFYVDNHEMMSKGAEVYWIHRKTDGVDHDALQHAMDLKLSDERAFASEFQNMPMAIINNDVPRLFPADIISRLNQERRFNVPVDYDLLTAFIDVGRSQLWYSVVAFNSATFSSAVIDYGCWPEQATTYFVSGQHLRSYNNVYADRGNHDACLQAALNDLVERLASKTYKNDLGHEFTIKEMAIDSGYKSQEVYAICSKSPFKHILVPTKGVGISEKTTKLVDPEKKPERGQSIQGQWKLSQTVVGTLLLRYDVNFWKSQVDRSMRVPTSNPGAFHMFAERADGKKPNHRMISEHMTAEFGEWKENGRRKVEVWAVEVDGADNHLFDCVVGAYMLAHKNGAKIPGSKKAKVRKRKRYRRDI